MVSRYYAVKELLENGVNSLPITREQIEDIITSKGFKIICYDASCKEHSDILDNLGVLQLADRPKAFTYISKQEKIVFIKIGVSTNEKRLLLAHELGHIAIGHMSDNGVIGYQPGGLIDEAQEDEANAFALEFLAPVCVLSQKHINTSQRISDLTLLDEKRSRLVEDEVHNHKRLTNIELKLFIQFESSDKSKKICTHKIITCAGIVLIIFAFMLILFLFYMPATHKYSASENTMEQSVIIAISEPSEYDGIVYVTKTGKKFHKQNCRHIKNSDTVIDIALDKAISTGYEPCKDCYSELNQ